MRSPPRGWFAVVIALSVGACTSTGTAEKKEAQAESPRDAPQPKETPPPVAVDDDPEPPVDPPAISGPNLEQLNEDIAGVGTEAFEAAFPEQAGGLSRTSMHSNAAGTAGRWGDDASATYGENEQAVDVNVTDMIRVWECKPGDWAAYVDEIANGKKTDPPTKVVKVDQRRALYTVEKSAELGTVHTLGLRLGERCSLGLSGDGVTKAGLIAVAEDLGLDALETACAKRDERGIGVGR